MDKDQKGIELRGADRALAAIAEPSQDTSGKYTVQVERATFEVCTVVVEADSVEQACEYAIDEADVDGDWREADDRTPSWAGLIRKGEHDDAWPRDGEDDIDIPVQFTQADTTLGRKTARASELYDALKSIIDYAERDVGELDSLADSDEARAEVAEASDRIDKARALLAELAD